MHLFQTIQTITLNKIHFLDRKHDEGQKDQKRNK